MTQDHEQHNREAEQAILEDVKEYGYHIALLEANNYLPAFVYTIGLYKTYGHPEIICFGLPTEVMGALIQLAGDMIKAGQKLETNKNYNEFLEGFPVQFIQVEKAHYANYVGYACWFYNSSLDFPLLQLVWPDKQNNFPWDAEFNRDWKFSQPLLDRNADFKFYEERNLGVFTTKQVLAGEPVLYVYHNNDGDWQFHCRAETDTADGVVVALEELTKRDPSLNEVFHLQYGWCAFRQDKQSEWNFEENPNEA